jgi:hypothetical protein
LDAFHDCFVQVVGRCKKCVAVEGDYWQKIK